MKQHRLSRTRIVSRQRRRGVAVVYVAALMIFMLVMASMVVDMGVLYRQQVRAQRAADAAALAGAFAMAHATHGGNSVDQDYASSLARYYAALPENGGYSDGVKSATVQTNYPGFEIVTLPNKTTQTLSHSNWYTVTITRPERTFFAWAATSDTTPTIIARASAKYTTNAPINISGLGTYGAAGTPVNLSLFGPQGHYSYGDCYSTQWLDNGVTPNPNFNPNGYNFLVNVPSSMRNVQFDVYDPDCYNPNGVNSGNGQYDELRQQNGADGRLNSNGTSPDATTTRYTLYDDNGTPSNLYDDVQLATMTYGGTSAADIAADSKWITMLTDRRTNRSKSNSNYRINVTPISGSSENGFNLRAGPSLTTGQAFNPSNGTSISADGHIPMNFNVDGDVNIALGTLPVEAAGGTMDIRKFDTDVNAKSIVYTCSSLPGKSWTGNLSGNGTFTTDTIPIPSNYTPGVWYATYTAGLGDTSVWDMSYSNSGPGSPGPIKLVR